tara:strand:+ start:8407 stop:8628 length:222 start_codon:yes stop_codon:yes gene_type:complete
MRRSMKQTLHFADCKRCGIAEWITVNGSIIGDIRFEGQKYEPEEICTECASELIDKIVNRWMTNRGYTEEDRE